MFIRGYLFMLFVVSSTFASWPTLHQNNQRNAKVEIELDAARLQQTWVWRSPAPPQPAWSGPAKWDAYAGIRDLKSMRNYDPVFHVIAVDGRVWFGSSLDHHIHCLDASTGSNEWTFATDGAVRIAPTYWNDKIYFGSDDGFAYCVHAKSGAYIWKKQARSCDRRIINNGSVISQWPVRSGVAVESGIAYFTASLLPWQESYLCAVDANTGNPDGPNQYVKRADYVTMEGPLALSPGRLLVVPQGRVAPQLFSIKTGTKLGDLPGGGGSFVVLTPESVVHGPGNKTGWLTATSLKSKEKIASFKDANAMVVAGDVSFVLGDRAITASNLQKKKSLWTFETDCNLALILVGNTLFAGGNQKVVAVDAASGKRLWQHAVDGRAYGLAAADGQLYVSTDLGIIHAFREGQNRFEAVEEDTAVQQSKSEDASNLKPIPTNDSKLLGHWAFQRPHVRGSVVSNLVDGGGNGTIEGKLDLARIGNLQAIRLDGNVQIPVSRDLSIMDLPKEGFSVEAWGRIDEPTTWGAFIGCIQDNGNFERGWLLGYNGQKFSFAICSDHGPGNLTYLTDQEDFTLRGWSHVVGTYDGQQMSLYVNGKLVNTSDQQKGPIKYPPTAVYEIAAYHDDNERYPIKGMLHEIKVHDRVIPAAEIASRYKAKAQEFPAPEPEETSDAVERFAVGPWVEFQTRDSATVHWQSQAKTTPTLRLLYGGKTIREFTTAAPTKTHVIKIDGLKRKQLYHFEIETNLHGETSVSQPYELDQLFNYSQFQLTENQGRFLRDDQRAKRFVAHLLKNDSAKSGICVVLGCGSGSLIYELARSTDLRIVAFDQDIDRAERVRYDLLQDGFYGSRATVHIVDSLQKIPVTGRFANLVVSESILSGDETQISYTEASRLLAPEGIACMTHLSSSRESFPEIIEGFEIVASEGVYFANRRSPPIPNSGNWSHIYGAANNSHYGGESLGQATKQDHLMVQWVGLPGARYQADRNGRKTPPLATAGRIYLQGLDRLIAMDQYNGSILWSKEIPHFRRFNVPRDCGNWCADDQHIFAAIRDRCWVFDNKTGKIHKQLSVPNSNQDEDWGFIAKTKKALFGSAVLKGNIWTDFWGKEAWYDGTSGIVAAKVCSDRVFSVDVPSESVNWDYQKGLIINSTISLDQSSVYFVEARHPDLLPSKTRRLEGAKFWEDQYLVALNLADGKKRWETKLKIQPGDVAFYSACKDDHVVLVASSDKKYHIYNFHAADGKDAWYRSLVWGKGKADHGSHLSRPAIVANRLFVRPGVFNLTTGEQSKLLIPVGGCGTYAATDSALFFRGGSGNNSAMWNIERGDYSMWNRLRPDCWLSTIPAGGMLLSPEGGGGCSCGKWMETSLGFMPKKYLE